MSGPGKGQQKTHQITNAQTGETRDATQEEWRQDGKQLRAMGWERVDDEGTEAPEAPEAPEAETDTGAAPEGTV